jgi:hypothetical protein
VIEEFFRDEKKETKIPTDQQAELKISFSNSSLI